MFLDRDGVIVVPQFRNGRSYAPKTLVDFCLYSESHSCLQKLKCEGYFIVIVTNQPDVGNNIISRNIVEKMHKQLFQKLPIDAIEVCYHAQQDHCDCRKPKPGMLIAAINKYSLDPNRSFMVGDRWSDIEAAKQLSIKTVFIDHNYSEKLATRPDFSCTTLEESIKTILDYK